LYTVTFLISLFLPFCMVLILTYLSPLEWILCAPENDRIVMAFEPGKAVLRRVEKQVAPIGPPVFTDASLHGPRFQATMQVLELTKFEFTFPLWVLFIIPTAASAFVIVKSAKCRRRVKQAVTAVVLASLGTCLEVP
jgi:hypothetical protein